VGSFYTNLALRGPDRDQIIAAVAGLGYCAFVSRSLSGLTMVCEERSDTRDLGIWRDVAKQLSRWLQCPALAVLNHDDDVLLYSLYRGGHLLDEYNSCPDYWINQDPPALPQGGDAAVLCEAFGMPGDAAEVNRILRATPGDEDRPAENDFVVAFERHVALVQALRWPEVDYYAGFDLLKREAMPTGWVFVG